MLITFACPKCASHFEIESTASGSTIACPSCQTALTVPQPRLGAGVTLGSFRIERLLGRGGMGEVYLARQLTMDRHVALKLLPPELTRSPDLVQRFRNEVRMAAKLTHPYVVTAYEAGEDGGVHFLAMEYVRGESLEQRLQRGGRLEEQEALRLVEKLAGALGYAWEEHRLLHRDIKPANILLDSHGEPKLTDMGLSKSLAEQGGMTLSGMVMGTPNYMSPEQAEGRGDLDCRADMYSLGATLYHMVTGEIPFAGSSVMETLRKQATESLPDPRTRNPGLSEGCVALLEVMLAKQREQRHGDWGAVVADVRRVAAGQMPAKTALGAGESVLLRRAAAGGGEPPHKVVLTQSRVAKLHDLQAQPAVTPAPVKGTKTGLLVGAAAAVVVLPAGGVLVGLSLGRGKKATAPSPAPVPAVAKTTPAVVPPAPVPPTGLAPAREDARPPLEAARPGVEGERPREPLPTPTLPAPAPEPTPAPTPVPSPEPRTLKPETSKPDPAGLLAALANELAAALLKGDSAAVQRQTDEAYVDAGVKALPEWPTFKAQAQAAAGWQGAVLDGFKADVGQEVTVGLVKGSVKVRVAAVGADGVRAREEMEGAQIERRLGVADLTLAEQVARLGRGGGPEAALRQGMALVRQGKAAEARGYFARAGAPLGEALVAEMDKGAGEAREQAAAAAYRQLLELAGVAGKGQTPEELAKAARATKYGEPQVGGIKQAVAAFREKHGGSEAAKGAELVLAALQGVSTRPLIVDEAAVEAALKALEKANPKVGKLLSSFECRDDGLVLNLANNPELADVSALSELPVVDLDLSKSKVSELEPLKGMPLRRLILNACPVVDIRPLEGMPIEELGLRIGGTYELSLIPLDPTILTRMPLRQLELGGRQSFSDLRLLRGLPLQRLDVTYCQQLRDIRALSGMPLTHLTLRQCPVSDLGPLAGMPLVSLDLSFCPIVDLRPLKGLPLQTLQLYGCKRLQDMSVLHDCPTLRELNLRGTGVADIHPLEEMPNLSNVDLPAGVDPSPLARCPALVSLCVDGRSVSIPELRMKYGQPGK